MSPHDTAPYIKTKIPGLAVLRVHLDEDPPDRLSYRGKSISRADFDLLDLKTMRRAGLEPCPDCGDPATGECWYDTGDPQWPKRGVCLTCGDGENVGLGVINRECQAPGCGTPNTTDGDFCGEHP